MNPASTTRLRPVKPSPEHSGRARVRFARAFPSNVSSDLVAAFGLAVIVGIIALLAVGG